MKKILTIALVTLSVLASIPYLLFNGLVFTPLLIATPGSEGLSEVASGQVWRLVTPIFLHFGWMHIVFNMIALWDLGRATEWLRGAAFFALFVVLTGVGSNLAQYLITGEAAFGGMSGVIFALLGYFWMQGRVNPAFGLALHQSTVVMMLAWFVLGWTGLLGPIANWAHTGGLLMGMAWGFFDRRPSPRARAQ